MLIGSEKAKEEHEVGGEVEWVQTWIKRSWKGTIGWHVRKCFGSVGSTSKLNPHSRAALLPRARECVFPGGSII